MLGSLLKSGKVGKTHPLLGEMISSLKSWSRGHLHEHWDGVDSIHPAHVTHRHCWRVMY